MKASINGGSELCTGTDPVLAVDEGILVAEASSDRDSDVVQILKESVIIRVGAEVSFHERVVNGERWGLLTDIGLEHKGENVCVEAEHIVFKVL